MLLPNPLTPKRDPLEAIRNLTRVGPKLARQIIEHLGDGDAAVAWALIERDPYLLMEVEGLGWKKSDTIAKTDFQVGNDDPRRHRAGNRTILELRGVLTEREFQAERAKLALYDSAQLQTGVTMEEGLYWMPEELEAELGLERWVRGLAPLRSSPLGARHEPLLDHLRLDDVQRQAVSYGLSNRVLCLTGGAGCGKTHVVAALSMCALADGLTVRGMAFAGKAADRMREAFDTYGVRAEATTIHKALGYAKRGFTLDVLAEDLIVIDESSMLPNWLLWAVVSRLKPGARLILVGDQNQLPPIGYGSPFADLIRHGAPRAHLSRNYRQAGQQGILQMAEGVLHRSRPQPSACVEMHLGAEDPESVFDQLVRQHGGQDFEAWQCITYQNENAERYNLRAQAIINPDGAPLFEYPLWKLGTDERNRPLNHAEMRVGDKVIVVKNSSVLAIFNGQTGRLVGQVWRAKQVQRQDGNGRWEIVDGEQMLHLRVEISNRMVDVPEDEAEKLLQLGYVITVHKAQGSDWDRVLVIQPGKVRDDTARRFFYTAITRAKVHLCIVSSLRVVAWWSNAAADAPDVPSSLLKRLARPAPDPAPEWGRTRCYMCGYEADLTADGYCADCEQRQLAAAVEPDWDALAEERHEQRETAAQAPAVIEVPATVHPDLHELYRSLKRANS